MYWRMRNVDGVSLYLVADRTMEVMSRTVVRQHIAMRSWWIQLYCPVSKLAVRRETTVHERVTAIIFKYDTAINDEKVA